MLSTPYYKQLDPAKQAGQIVNAIPHHQVKAPIDFYLSNEGSIWILEPASDAGREWIDDNIPSDATRWGPSVAIEPRYVQRIVDGIRGDGLEVRA